MGQLYSGPSQAANACAADRIDSWVTVSAHHDGDTLRLADGRKLRLIGLDTPELGRDGKPDQALAKEATQALGDLLKQSPRVGLRYDQERHDRYSRTLAHLYLEDGRSVAATLLEQGLATLLVVPPNSWNYRCLARQQQQAREARRGLWALPQYQAITSAQLADKPRRQQGFARISGKVERVGESAKALWIHLEGPMTLRIPKEHALEFSGLRPKQWVGRRVLASGWLRYHESKYQMTIKHPSAIEFITE